VVTATAVFLSFLPFLVTFQGSDPRGYQADGRSRASAGGSLTGYGSSEEKYGSRVT